MSDIEGSGGLDDDLSLPKATVQKLINEMMPPDIACAKETRDLLIECCVEFIHLIASEANEICEKEAKKTIAPEHVLSALKSLGFETYLSEVREKKSSKLRRSGMSEEELLRMQQELFDQARQRMQASQNTATEPQPPASE
ncbi:histone-fold-containing protein [Syncephalis pseudoplumigaleata]|uniref:Histone-fold-containing protein n=1 Tax=Syncephalis pseudoplumigaleata TaxID=1712513 RepID=A0A4P9Z279_9FUNG|nr:histone-fold-containing protein [Syncephalis pseudoplumigaleata]|eukprot:RKP26072.1 histone-fold-containing protein [Syncephalis pseudoplumigaleata]